MVQQFLKGINVVELPGLAPAPFCGMLLADFGAEVTLVINTSSSNSSLAEYGQKMARKKRIVNLEFNSDVGRTELLRLCLHSDVLLDPFRPGILESIGLDPTFLREKNPGLIIVRITGYGQTGPLSARAGHDINYVALSGILPTISGKSNPSTPPRLPANLLADFAAGGLLAAFGVVSALFRRAHSAGCVSDHFIGRQGCVLDCAMTEGLAYLGTFLFATNDEDLLWHDKYALFSGNCPIYRTYQTLDGKWMAVGAVESKFRQKLFNVLNIDENHFEDLDQLTREMEQTFRTKTRSEWTEIFREMDACVTPVLDIDEVGQFEQHLARGAFISEEQKELGMDAKISKRWIPREVPREVPMPSIADKSAKYGSNPKERAKL